MIDQEHKYLKRELARVVRNIWVCLAGALECRPSEVMLELAKRYGQWSDVWSIGSSLKEAGRLPGTFDLRQRLLFVFEALRLFSIRYPEVNQRYAEFIDDLKTIDSARRLCDSGRRTADLDKAQSLLNQLGRQYGVL